MSNDHNTQLAAIIASIKEQLAGAVTGEELSYGDLVIVVDRKQSHDVLKMLYEAGFNLLLDIAGVDLSETDHDERFMLVYNLYSMSQGLRLRVKLYAPETDMNVPSVSDVWESANWAEREAYDMFGFRFEGHPNLVRILCHHQFEGHALRKDYPVMKGQWATSAVDLMPELERE